MMLFFKLKEFIVLLLIVFSFISCAKSKIKNEIENDVYVDLMKSDTLTDKSLNESWNLLTQGQQLADEGNSIDSIINTFPEGTIFQTNNTSILFFIDGSIPMVIELDKDDAKKSQTKGGGYTGKTLNVQSVPQLSLSTNFLSTSFNKNEGLVDVLASDKNDYDRQKKKALILSPYIEQFGKYDDGLIAYEYLKKNRNYKDNTTFLKNKFTLNDFLSFGEYDLVHLSTHGSVFCNPKNYIKKGIIEIVSGGDSNFCTTLISTNIKHGIKYKGNKERFKKKILEKYGEKFDGLIAWNTETVYLKGTFFDKTYNDLDNKIWIFSACETGVRSDLSESMKRIHTNGHYFSWLYSVNANDAFNAFNKFYENLISKGLDAEKAFNDIPISLKEDLPSTLPDTSKDTIETTTSLLHLQTDNPRHGIEVIDMLNPENKSLVQEGDFYPLVGDFNDGKDETLTLKVKLIGYTKAEFLEKQMSISLEVDDNTVLSSKSFLPDIEDDEVTVELLKDHKFGVLVTISDIAIPDVGTKEEINLKAILHLNNEKQSIHKEKVFIVAKGIEATFRDMKMIYDDKTKAVKTITPHGNIYYDNEGAVYKKERGNSWIKIENGGMNVAQFSNMPSSVQLQPNDIQEAKDMSSGLPPFINFAINFRMISFEKNNKFKKRVVDCGLPNQCNKFTNKEGVYAMFNPAGRLIQFGFPNEMIIKYKYGDYDVKLPKAKLFKMPILDFKKAEQEWKKHGIDVNFN